MTLELDMLQTAAVGILAMLLGSWINKSVKVLQRICIPAPVTGGIVFSLMTLALYGIFGIEISFQGTLKDICMMMFFTSVGFQSDLSVLRKGGRPLIVMVVLVAVLIVCQNAIGLGISRGCGFDPLIGLAAGSVTQCGGHGTAAGFSPLFEQMGMPSATTVLMAAATFGLLGGSLMGGPLAEHIIRRKHLRTDDPSDAELQHGEEAAFSASGYAKAVYEILLAAGLGTLVSKALALTGLSFPSYFGALVVAVIMRNVSEAIPRCPKLSMPEITSVGGISLALFLGMAMASLRLWELSGLALPLLLVLAAQLLFMLLFARTVAFPLLGGDYDAAVMVSGLCGFGLGATPNAMANMSAVCGKYRYSTTPFIIIPIVGAMFVDLINIAVVSIFLNLI